MTLFSWNVNGLRAVMDKGFEDILRNSGADIFCLQETKLSTEVCEMPLDGYEHFWNVAEKKGYSGTGIYTLRHPLNVTRGIGVDEHDHEGRVLTLEFDDFYLVNVYTPNSQTKLARLSYRMEWEDAFRDYVCRLDAVKPVIICGDMNVAHCEIDLKNPDTNHNNAGFTDSERDAFSRLLDAGFTDTFRYLHPDEVTYSWWSYRFRAREKNVGWRIDYFLISNRLLPRLTQARIHTDILGSDHCPVSITLTD
ncbi:MAG: exodeoxyribonuclease III [Muribaculaceae bacterium]